MTHTVLIVDDEKNIRRTLDMVLESEGYHVLTAESAEHGLQLVESEAIDVLLLDVRLPGMDGLVALPLFLKKHSQLRVIMISGHASLHDAVEATKLGAFDFLQKPLDRERVVITVRNAAAQVLLSREVSDLRQDLNSSEMVGDSPVMRSLHADIKKVAPTKAFVLITGESGTGKELIARSIHKHSGRSENPFVKVNCAAIPTELIESELFGHEKGSFTGAEKRRRGQFELADGGTIFLDEIGDMSPTAQAKVLRTLQTGEISRVGSEKIFRVDVRVISATNKNLKEEVEAGRFREDLFFRLNVVPLQSPPLRERASDIPLLVDHFATAYCKENGFRKKAVHTVVSEALTRYAWPGNVRELKNLIERMVIMSDDAITADDLPAHIHTDRARVTGGIDTSGTLKDFRERLEREMIIQRLEEYQWNISKAAISLGIERTNLHKKLKYFQIARDLIGHDENPS